MILALAAIYVGSSACLPCHAKQAGQVKTSHAQALQPFAGSELASALLKQRTIGDRGNRHVYSPGSVTTASASMSLEWTFGSGVQAYTAVGRSAGEWIEHRISWFAAPARLSLTPGHIGRQDLLGIPQDQATIKRCFNCHSRSSFPDLSNIELGVQCERCHGPGSDHVASPKGTNILNSGRFPAEASVMVCGECHRTPPRRGSSPTPELDDPLSIRFQPVGLMASRCFQASKRLACTTCHDPHANASRDPAFYTAKCMSCHATPHSSENCLPCHMARSSPAPHLTFTDHRIRIQ